MRVPSARGDNEQTPQTPSSPSRGLAPDWAAAEEVWLAALAAAAPTVDAQAVVITKPYCTGADDASTAQACAESRASSLGLRGADFSLLGSRSGNRSCAHGRYGGESRSRCGWAGVPHAARRPR